MKGMEPRTARELTANAEFRYSAKAFACLIVSGPVDVSVLSADGINSWTAAARINNVSFFRTNRFRN